MKIKKGDPVRVRLSNGEVVNASYYGPSPQLGKCHHVNIGGIPYLALGGNHERRGVLLKHECRFVGPTPMVKKRRTTMNNTNDMRAAFQDFRDQRNKELAANGLDDQSNFWITNAHYTAWCRGIAWQSQQAQGAGGDNSELEMERLALSMGLSRDDAPYAKEFWEGGIEWHRRKLDFHAGMVGIREKFHARKGARPRLVDPTPPAPAAVPDEAFNIIEGIRAELTWSGWRSARSRDWVMDRLSELLSMLTASPVPDHAAEADVCQNCETALPEGCGGIFAHTDTACRYGENQQEEAER